MKRTHARHEYLSVGTTLQRYLAVELFKARTRTYATVSGGRPHTNSREHEQCTFMKNLVTPLKCFNKADVVDFHNVS